MSRKTAAVLFVLVSVFGTIVADVSPLHAGTDWNVWTVKGRVMSVYRETDDNTSALVKASVTVATGSELITIECDTADADCDFALTDPCTTTSVAVGAIDFVDRSFSSETCTSGAGKCLYGNGMLHVDTSDGRMSAPAITTTVLAIGDCTSR
jgi:hypothetical protein